MTKNRLDQIKNRTIMYTNQIDTLKALGLPTTRDELFQHFKTTFEPLYIAATLHDKDIGLDGSTVKPHFHVGMRFENPISITAQAKKINDRYQNFIALDGINRNNTINMMSYLTHQTRDSQSKFQYSPHDVKANFNYPEWLGMSGGSIAISRKAEINILLKEFGDDENVV
ncbi:hypothetical protein BFC22_11640 [Carnobacterium divergens]|nr:hypothetical protein BFC22_11640 [Carnobacterium divergens]